jgi:hypothetical protein
MRTEQEIRQRLNRVIERKVSTYSNQRKQADEIKALCWVLGADEKVSFMNVDFAVKNLEEKDKLGELRKWLSKN